MKIACEVIMEREFCFDDEISDYKMNDLVEVNYPDQLPAQMPIYLKINMEKEPPYLFFDTCNYRLNGTPANEWHNRTLVWELPYNFDASTAKNLISKIEIYLNILIRSFSIEWDGSNNVGVYHNDVEDLQDAVCHIQYLIDENVETFYRGGLIDVKEYYEPVTTYLKSGFCKVAEYKIMYRTNDKALRLIAKKLNEELEEDGFISDINIENWLFEIRDEMIEEIEMEEEN